MKVILLQDVKKVGKKNDILEVSAGYASNFLFPRKLAVQYTAGSLKVLDQQKADKAAHEAKLKKEAEELKEKLKNITLEFTAKTGKDGRMFGTISIKQVVDQLKNKYGYEVDKRKFVDKIAIDTLGIVVLKNELYKGVIAEIRVHVGEEK